MKKKVLVCITPQSNSKRLIDMGSDISNKIYAELHILHVEIGKNILNSNESTLLLQHLFEYGSALGGTIHGICGDEAYTIIKEFVKELLITDIVLGMPTENNVYVSESISEKFMIDLPYIRVHILERE